MRFSLKMRFKLFFYYVHYLIADSLAMTINNSSSYKGTLNFIDVASMIMSDSINYKNIVEATSSASLSVSDGGR